MTLASLGWNGFFASGFAPYADRGCVPARVATQQRGHYLLFAETGELRGEVAGAIHFRARRSEDFPSVGDWVAITYQPGDAAATIIDILPRQTAFRRKAPGMRHDRQILAANIDTAFLVTAADLRFNLRSLERYLVLTKECGAAPVIILNKVDLCDDVEEWVADIRTVAPDVPLVSTSATNDTGLEKLGPWLRHGSTAALLGPSGVGKSTIVNCLLGKEYQRTQEVREADSRGRHTTTHRELILLPEGGLLMDTPGLRELQLTAGEGIADTFDEITALAAGCRFRDCRHEQEPGCAVREALENGTLEPDRLDNFRKLQREIAHRERESSIAARIKEKQRIKRLMLDYRRGKKKG